MVEEYAERAGAFALSLPASEARDGLLLASDYAAQRRKSALHLLALFASASSLGVALDKQGLGRDGGQNVFAGKSGKDPASD